MADTLKSTPRALDPPAGDFFFPSQDFWEHAVEASRKNPRRRIMVPIQRAESAPVQRLLNVMQPGSYVQPHRHPRPQATELAYVISGRMRVWIFDKDGSVRESRECSSRLPDCLVDLEPGIWHTFAALEPDTIILEIKGGPYDAKLDKEFAPWAPPENDPAAPDYLKSLLAS
jgi:cupin fold WbuC family metalloprotein